MINEPKRSRSTERGLFTKDFIELYSPIAFLLIYSGTASRFCANKISTAENCKPDPMQLFYAIPVQKHKIWQE